MTSETLLTTLWNMEGEDDAANAEIVRQQLLSGDLEPAGNCRNEAPSYWAEDDEK